MYCNNCGKEIDDNAVICIHCGAATKLYQPISEEPTDSSLGCLLCGICFLFPIVGLILYIVWQNTYPNKAKAAGKWALIGFIVGIVIGILYWLLIAGSLISAFCLLDY